MEATITDQYGTSEYLPGCEGGGGEKKQEVGIWGGSKGSKQSRTVERDEHREGAVL
jgi:hypothetical protein